MKIVKLTDYDDAYNCPHCGEWLSIDRDDNHEDRLAKCYKCSKTFKLEWL